MDFKSFKNNRKRSEDTPSQEDLRKTAERYSGKSDAELLGEIAKAANQERRDGTFSNEKLDAFADNLAPMLSAEQKERLAQAIRMIKGN